MDEAVSRAIERTVLASRCLDGARADVEALMRRGGTLGHQPKPLGHPVDVGIDGEVRLVEREQQHARGGLRANTR